MFDEIIKQANDSTSESLQNTYLYQECRKTYQDACGLVELVRLFNKQGDLAIDFAQVNANVLSAEACNALQSMISRQLYTIERQASDSIHSLFTFAYDYAMKNMSAYDDMAETVKTMCQLTTVKNCHNFPTFEEVMKCVAQITHGYIEHGKWQIAKKLPMTALDKNIPNSIVFKSIDCFSQTWSDDKYMLDSYARSMEALKSFIAFVHSDFEHFSPRPIQQNGAIRILTNAYFLNQVVDLSIINHFESMQFVVRGNRQKTLLLTMKEPNMAERLLAEIWGK